MKESYQDLRSLYGAARRDEEPTRADRRAVRTAIMSAGASVVSFYVSNATGKLISLLPGGAKALTVGQVVVYASIGASIGGGVAAVGAALSPPPPGLSQVRHSVHEQSRMIHPRPSTTGAVLIAPPPDVTAATSGIPQLQSSPQPGPAWTAAPVTRVTPAVRAHQESGANTVVEAESTRAAPLAAEPAAAASAPVGAAVEPPSLVQESRALAAVQAALSAHDGYRALQLLDAQDRDFGSGSLAQERAAARVLALCAAGQAGAARAAKQRFLTAYPGSPLARRIGTACEK